MDLSERPETDGQVSLDGVLAPPPPRPLVRAPRPALLVVLVGLGLIGLLSAATYLTVTRSPSGSGPMDMAGSSMSASSCALVPSSTLSSMLVTAVAAPRASATARRTTCTYGVAGTADAVIRYTMDVTPQRFDAEAASLAPGAAVAHLNGLGDEAVEARATRSGSSVTALLVRRGSNQLLVLLPGSPAQAHHLAELVLPSL